MRWDKRYYILLALLLLSCLPLPAQAPKDVLSSGGKHPVEIKADADCSECHGNLSQGKYVHTAMSMGCTTCHSVTNKPDGSYVELVSPVSQLCFMCHTVSTQKVLHGPYKQGDCVLCHSPHSSNFPQHTWAAHQDICLGCHTHQRMKFDAATHIGLLPWGATVTAENIRNLPYLDLTKKLTRNHPLPNHPVWGPNKPAGKDAPPVTCLSCHNPHASDFAFLYAMPDKWENYPCPNCLICMKCHVPSSLAN